MVAAILTGRIALGGLAALGALVILHLPASPGPMPLYRLLGCAGALTISLALGQLSTAWPSASLPLFGGLIAAIVAATRLSNLPPPGHTLFVLAAGSGAAAGFHPEGLLDLVLVPPASAAMAIGIGWAAHRLSFEGSSHAAPAPLMASVPGTPAREVLIEALVFGVFAMLALAIALGIGLERPYWVPVSCVSVMRGVTLQAVWTRSLQRIAGTLLGVVCTLLLLAVHPGPWVAVTILVLLVLGIYRTLGQNYAVTVLLATPALIVITELASINQVPDLDLLITRMVDIALGSSIGLAGGTILKMMGRARTRR